MHNHNITNQFRARRTLGQHFLFDPNILDRIAQATGPIDGRTVIEVGPGPGGLTRCLLDRGVTRLICVETDRRFAAALRNWPEVHKQRLIICEQDARTSNWTQLIADAGGETPALIIANLPYNIATPLLVDWLTAGSWRGAMALMLQKEVADRICAEPGGKHYGRLAVLSSCVCKTHIAFTLPPGAFKPPPAVKSALAVFHPLDRGCPPDDLNTIQTVTRAAFGQRRKMLRTALGELAKTVGLSPNDWIRACGVDPAVRAETVTPAQFRALAGFYANTQTQK